MGQMVAEHVIAQATPVEAGRTGMLLLADNQDGFAARVLAARGATVSLDLMYYLWHDDHTGRLLRQEVIKAADRGVRVRMLLDDFNPRANDSTYLALDSHPNISLRLFNPSKARGNRLARWFELVYPPRRHDPPHAQQGVDRRRQPTPSSAAATSAMPISTPPKRIFAISTCCCSARASSRPRASSSPSGTARRRSRYSRCIR